METSMLAKPNTNSLWFMTAHLIVHLSQVDNADGISIIEHRMAEDFGPPLHIHYDEDETFIVLEGVFRFQLGGYVREAKAGDIVFLPKGVQHGFKVVSSEGGRCLTITRGRFEDMVRAASRPALAETLPEQVPPTREQQAALADICSKHGIDLIGPPIA
jgi:quercetin dioxygenase-like cupin family protein